jgi:hypothetical protein
MKTSRPSEFSRFRRRGLGFLEPQDYQFISTPAFNRDRGPMSVFNEGSLGIVIREFYTTTSRFVADSV